MARETDMGGAVAGAADSRNPQAPGGGAPGTRGPAAEGAPERVRLDVLTESQAQRSRKPVAVLLIDLAGFKHVNDTPLAQCGGRAPGAGGSLAGLA